jgi:hypothetical protein
LLATYLKRRARRLDRALRTVDVEVSLRIVALIILRTGSEKVFLAGYVAAFACRWVCGVVFSLFF